MGVSVAYLCENIAELTPRSREIGLKCQRQAMLLRGLIPPFAATQSVAKCVAHDCAVRSKRQSLLGDFQRALSIPDLK